MNIGYACLTVGVMNTKISTCMLKNASLERLTSLIQSNLNALDHILDYNIENGIKLFRISSDIIPFGSHPVNSLEWWTLFELQLKEIGEKARANDIRLSMHPGQYTVLNSPDQGVVERAVLELQYHAKFLDAMGLGFESKIVLHIGGAYGDKVTAIERFRKQYRCLDKNVRSRLVIENDDRVYTIADVLSIGQKEGIPVVFDNLHHKVNPDNRYEEIQWITACKKTWKQEDGTQKIHYSQQAESKRLGSHSLTLDMDDFQQFYNSISDFDLDIMVEVKDKNLSALKCVNVISSPKIHQLEQEWGRYKYLVLEHSPRIYNEIRQLLKVKKDYPVLELYRLIDEARRTPIVGGVAVNAAQHIWGYVNILAGEKSTKRFKQEVEKVKQGGTTVPIKRLLWKLAVEQGQSYLIDSLYFMGI